MMLAGRMRSTNTFFWSTISSPDGARIAWKIRREGSGHSDHCSGRTTPSI